MNPVIYFSDFLTLQSAFKMCEKRIRKIKRGTHSTRIRETRRLQRVQRLTIATSPPNDDYRPQPVVCPTQPILMDKALQNRVLLELAWKTVVLMQKNKLIQQKIVDLQKETTEFVSTVLTNPESRQRYLDHLQVYGIISARVPQPLENKNVALKIEPKE